MMKYEEKKATRQRALTLRVQEEGRQEKPTPRKRVDIVEGACAPHNSETIQTICLADV